MHLQLIIFSVHIQYQSNIYSLKVMISESNFAFKPHTMSYLVTFLLLLLFLNFFNKKLLLYLELQPGTYH